MSHGSPFRGQTHWICLSRTAGFLIGQKNDGTGVIEMAFFYLQIIASDRVFFHGEAEIVIVPEMDGACAFMAHHENMVVAVQPGELRYRPKGGDWQYAVVGTGFAQVVNNRVTVLVDTAERPEEIDEARARLELERAREEMRQKQSIQEYRMTQATMARALSRLKGKERHSVNL